MIEIKNWRLQGGYFETCNCVTACPCVWFQPPSEGDCKLMVAWHIDTGYFGELSLDALNVALACYAPGHMKQGNWQAALYVDERADEQQLSAITQIFSGQQGGHMAVLMSFVGEVLGIRQVKIDYYAEPNRRRLVIPGISQVEIESIRGIDGGQATIANPPLCVVPSHASVVATSKSYEYQDYGKNWQFSQRSGYYSEFVYQP